MDLRDRGARLWASLLKQDQSLEDELNPMREVALSACRTADRLERLEELTVDAEPVVETRSGWVTNPALAEVRQQATLLARLVSSLRLPDAAGKRPQHRSMRGVHSPAAVAAGSSQEQPWVSSLERMRLRSLHGEGKEVG